MDRTPVDSSVITSLGYDAETQTLEVEFNNGDVWQYECVPQDVCRDFLDSGSLGAYLNEHIKGTYPEIRVN